ncbi:hypothetical protein BK704_12435 [[Bacillus thuringiensis] serovar konkukian]|nr:hypothetical protein [Bacillus thuringiensis]MED1305199.1 hypothetical protein [Bacillus pacificus]OUB09012.1 hypothetical protein BK704_12435 [[Bacillus thuringiensis] serovar konkukian]
MKKDATVLIPKNVDAKFELVPNTGIGWREMSYYIFCIPIFAGIYFLPLNPFIRMGLGILLGVMVTALAIIKPIKGCHVNAGRYLKSELRFLIKREKKKNVIYYKKY